MKSIVCALLCMFFTGTSFAETRDAEQHFFDMKMGDFKSELATAKADGKTGILVMFEQEGCPYCIKMKNTILNQSEVQDYFHQHFLVFPIDIRGDLPMQDFSGKETIEKTFSADQGVYGTPTFVFFDHEGKDVTRFRGAAKDVDEFMLLGKCVVEGDCKTKSFAEYKKQAK